MSELIKQVYLNHDQCALFSVDYFEECAFWVSCQDLRRSKSYDESHQKIFDKYPSDIFHLSRRRADPPGWYSWTVLEEGMLLLKSRGHSMPGSTGVLINAHQNSAGNLLAQVLTGENSKSLTSWYLPQLDLVKHED